MSQRAASQRDPWDRASNNFAAWVWEQLDSIDLVNEFAHQVQTTQTPPVVIRKDYINAQGYALRRFEATHNDGGFAEIDQERALKLHLLLSRMMLGRLAEQGAAGRAVLQDRVRRFYRGEWCDLVREAFVTLRDHLNVA